MSEVKKKNERMPTGMQLQTLPVQTETGPMADSHTDVLPWTLFQAHLFLSLTRQGEKGTVGGTFSLAHSVPHALPPSQRSLSLHPARFVATTEGKEPSSAVFTETKRCRRAASNAPSGPPVWAPGFGKGQGGEAGGREGGQGQQQGTGRRGNSAAGRGEGEGVRQWCTYCMAWSREEPSW